LWTRTGRLWLTVKDVNGSDSHSPLSVFTRTPEAVYGVSHISLSPTHAFNNSKYYKVCKVLSVFFLHLSYYCF